jgi:hypothetical protein
MVAKRIPLPGVCCQSGGKLQLGWPPANFSDRTNWSKAPTWRATSSGGPESLKNHPWAPSITVAANILSGRLAAPVWG